MEKEIFNIMKTVIKIVLLITSAYFMSACSNAPAYVEPKKPNQLQTNPYSTYKYVPPQPHQNVW